MSRMHAYTRTSTKGERLRPCAASCRCAACCLRASIMVSTRSMPIDTPTQGVCCPLALQCVLSVWGDRGGEYRGMRETAALLQLTVCLPARDPPEHSHEVVVSAARRDGAHHRVLSGEHRLICMGELASMSVTLHHHRLSQRPSVTTLPDTSDAGGKHNHIIYAPRR